MPCTSAAVIEPTQSTQQMLFVVLQYTIRAIVAPIWEFLVVGAFAGPSEANVKILDLVGVSQRPL